MPIPQAFIIYIASVSLISAALVFYDKCAARRLPRHRIRERTLFILAALGGALVMYAAMRLCRHKTLHRRFMIGLPLIFSLHVVLCAALLWQNVFHVL